MFFIIAFVVFLLQFQFLHNGNCLANFDHMVVSGVKREGKGRNDDFVTDYKYAFVFFTTVKIQDKEIPLKVSVASDVKYSLSECRGWVFQI